MELVAAYSSDDNYSRHVMVSALSLLDNNQDFDSIKIYVIDNGIAKKNKSEIKKIMDKYGAKLVFKDFKQLENKLKTDGTFSVSAFGRLFLDDFIEEDKVLYLDCDSAIKGSFMELMQMDMGDNICAGVQDNVDVYFKKAIGMKADDIYINSGFLLIDLKKWRAEHMQEKAIAMIKKFNGSVPHHDQGVINAICYKRIMRLHPKYNYQCPMFEYKPKELAKMIPNYYSEQELNEAKDKPVFIHYTEGFSNRPWRDTCTHPNKDVYIKYQNQTPYAGVFEHKGINKHSNMVLQAYRLLPFPIYRALMKIIMKLRR